MTPRRAGSWSLAEEDVREIQRILEAFRGEANAVGALLVDRTGQLIARTDDGPPLDLAAFASLAAADFSANDQLASLLGEAGFTSLVHQGDRTSLFLADVARRAVLVVLFDDRTTLGLVRLKGKGAVQALHRKLRELFTRVEAGEGRVHLEGEWLHEAEDLIDRLFQD